MTAGRESMMLCGEPLDPVSQGTYDKLRADLRRYINENATSDAKRIAPDYDQFLQQLARDRVRKGFCKRPEYQLGKGVVLDVLRPQRELAIRKRLEVPGDPTKGDCF
jgi:hypothetical protein